MAERAALITGGSSGIGLAIARALGEDGYALTVSARRPEKLETAAEGLRTDGIEVQLDPTTTFGQTYFLLDPNSVPATDDSTDDVYELRDMYLEAFSPQLGRLAGWYEEGTLWVNLESPA